MSLGKCFVIFFVMVLIALALPNDGEDVGEF